MARPSNLTKVKARGVQAPRTRKPAELTAIDFAPDHWVIVKGSPDEVAIKLSGAKFETDLIEFTRFDSTKVFINPQYVKCLGVPS